MSPNTKRGYLICSTERTGSSLLALALHSTGVAGHPYEYFNPVLLHTPWMQAILDGSAMLGPGIANIFDRGTTANGVFGVKLHWLHAKHLAQSLLNDDPLPTDLKFYLDALSGPYELPEWLWDPNGVSFTCHLLQTRLPDLRFIWVKRRNAVARAISLYRALHTGVWHREHHDAADTSAAPPFAYPQISALRIIGSLQNAAWSQVFSELDVRPHVVWYEDLVHGYDETVRGVLNYLELDPPYWDPPGLEPQADMLSLEWELRYRQQRRR